MKDRLKTFFILLIFFSFNFVEPIFSNEIEFEAKNIESINENLIKASDNIIISDSQGNKIYGDKLIIEDKKVYTISGNVIFENIDDSIKLITKKIIFNVYDNTIRSFGNTKIIKNKSYFVNTSNILYNIKNKNISSSEKTLVEDLQSNKIEVKNFNISLIENLFKANNAFIIDRNLNQYELEKIFYDFKNNRILGKDLILNQDNNLSN